MRRRTVKSPGYGIRPTQCFVRHAGRTGLVSGVPSGTLDRPGLRSRQWNWRATVRSPYRDYAAIRERVHRTSTTASRTSAMSSPALTNNTARGPFTSVRKRSVILLSVSFLTSFFVDLTGKVISDETCSSLRIVCLLRCIHRDDRSRAEFSSHRSL